MSAIHVLRAGVVGRISLDGHRPFLWVVVGAAPEEPT